MKLPRILIIDDDVGVRLMLERTLKTEDYYLESVSSGLEALQKLSETSFDLILLDLYMEPIDGMTVFQAVRELDPEIVVIILTGYSSVESAVEALRLGAFDYLFKPVMPDTIRQRVREGVQYHHRMAWRRQMLAQIENLRQAVHNLDAETALTAPPSTEQRFVYSNELVIDCHHRLATLSGKLLNLTTAEFDLLLCLVKAAPEPMSPRQLVNCALGYNTEDTEAHNIIKWHIHHLRRKIEATPNQPLYIKTVRHKGYLWRGDK